MQPQQLHSVVADEFAAVNQCILQHLHSEVALVETIGHYIINSGGKRVRPLLTLLTAMACEYQGKDHIPLAAIIEFIHTATLLHDDVVDTSDMRRGRPTANAEWGNAPSVLVGDFLYSRSFQMLVAIGNMDIMKTISHATNVIAEGEVLQLLNCNNPDTTEADYMRVIHGKTAMLFEASALAAAQLSGASASACDALQRYGRHLGAAFQLMDDILDYTGNAEEMGKNVGDDLAEGKPTLPLIYAMRTLAEDEAQLIRNAIEHGGLEQLDRITACVRDCGALDYTVRKAEEERDLALECLAFLPESAYKAAMINLAYAAVRRSK
ncbi:octaprenyl diphosphate synthase [Pokkaliibacter plantistimulans]|uniref:Octaprenyl diphosphate synthase n=1 Tax=Proteobacteria bacterium 228 TaxID=2083153 RepID=A0A2S5KWP4_9PROT|nr:octaprenyl diphosphate synthase [Pokkaliibacter plantistimulans]PPC79143.1 octaprenyl diphosphate synthase [Pokkaliibacter plantistimulans]